MAPEADKKKLAKTNWNCIYLSTVLTFASSIQFTLFLPSLWPFMVTLDKSVTESFYGLVISTYSVFQIVGLPLLGYWSNRIELLKPPLIFCNVMMLLGNVLYFLVELFPARHFRYVLMVSRFFGGIGWAQVGLLKSYASAASIAKDRGRATAFITGGVAMGFTLGPAFQLVFSIIDYPGWTFCFAKGWCINLSMFTAPPLLASLFNLAQLALLILWFQESFVGIIVRKRKKKKQQSDNEKKVPNDKNSSISKLPAYDRGAAITCYALRFTQFFIFTNNETIGSAFAMMMFSWSSTEVVFYESISHCFRGAITLAVYIGYIMFDLDNKINGRNACIISLILLFMFHLITFSWPFLSSNVHKFDSSVFIGNASTNVTLGCDMHRVDWCTGLTQINVWLYYVLMSVFIGLAFPVINVAMNTLFSHIIGPRMQSTQQGVLEMYGGIGRMLGPLLIGFLYCRYGPRFVWLLESAVIGLMLVHWLTFYRRLVPLKIPERWNSIGNNDKALK